MLFLNQYCTETPLKIFFLPASKKFSGWCQSWSGALTALAKTRLRRVVLRLGGIFDLCGDIGNLRLTDGGQSGARDFGFCHPFSTVRFMC